MFVTGLGTIPGPIDKVYVDQLLYLVDPRRAGEVHGNVVCCTHADAVELLLGGAQELPPVVPAHPVDDAWPSRATPVTTAKAAAELLGVSRDVVDRLLNSVALADLPEGVRPIRTGTRRTRTRWESLDHLQRWWKCANDASTATPTAGSSKARRRPRTRKVHLENELRELARAVRRP